MKTVMTVVLALLIPALFTLNIKGADLGESLHRRYDQNTYLAAHNAFANSDSHYRKTTANQVYDIKEQLDDGVRCLLLDTYLVRQIEKDFLLKFEMYEKRGETKPSSDFEDAGLEVVLAHNPKTWGYSLFSDYIFINRPFENIYNMLVDLKEWMDENPNEVVTLVFESYVAESSVMFDYFNFANLINSLFFADRPNPGMRGPDGQSWNVTVHGWPRLSQMVAAGKRLVIFSSNGVQWSRYSGQPIGGARTDQDDGLPHYWDFVVENVYGDPSILGEVGKPRGASDPLDSPLIALASMNWFPTANVVGPDYEGDNLAYVSFWDMSDVNDYDDLNRGRKSFVSNARRYPNFLNVDFYHKGDDGGPRKAVREWNKYWANRPTVLTFLSVSPAPNSFGWRKSATVTARPFALGAQKLSWINYYWHGGHDFIGHAEATSSVPVSVTMPTLSISPTNATGGVDGIFRISVEALNQAYDRSDRAVTIVRVDATGPTVAPSITRAPDGEDDWYNHPVTISVKVFDLLSGPRRAGSANLAGQAVLSDNYVSSVTNQFIERTFEFPYEQEGHVFVQFYAEDYAGNRSAEDSGFILVKLDRMPPSTSVNLSTGGTDSTTIRLEAHDTLSGISETWFQLDDQTEWTTYTEPLTITAGTPHTLRFYSRDVAGNVEATRTYHINQVAIGLSSSRNPAAYFQSLLLTANVAAPGAVPTGTVTFFDGDTPMATRPLDVNGMAELELNPFVYTLPRGTRELTARYNGDANNGPVTSQVLLQDVVDAPGVQLTTSTRNIIQTQPIKFTAKVFGPDDRMPTGTVRFRVLNSASGRELLSFTEPLDANGQASVTTDQLPFGTLWLFADYSGDAAFPPGSSGGALEIYVSLAETFVSVTTSPNPSRLGEPVTFSVNVSNTEGVPPFKSGAVRIEANDTVLETLVLDESGHATFTTSALEEGDHFFVLTADTTPRFSGGVTSHEHSVLTAIVTNNPPTLAPIEDATVNEGQLLTVTTEADDLDAPAQTLTFSLAGTPPAGASIDPATGVFQWTPDKAQAGASYTINIQVQDDGEPSMSATESFVVTVTEGAPVIITPPADVTQMVGSTAVFNVVASGEDLSYQWQFNGQDLVNETSDTLTLTNLRIDHGGNYAVRVSNASGSVLSAPAQLMVKLAPVDLGATEGNPVTGSATKLTLFNAAYSSHPLNIDLINPSSIQNGSISRNGDLITYTPPSGYAGQDTFTYYVSTDLGVIAVGEVLVNVAPANAASLNLISITVNESSRVIRCAGIPGREYLLQSAPEANGPWSDLSVPIKANSSGLLQFVDKTEPLPSIRFYRVRAVPTNP